MDNEITVNCCRICLEKESKRVNILEDPTIQLHLKSCLSITVSSNDPLPTFICSACVLELTHFYNFQMNAQYSQDWLQSIIEEKSKKQSEVKTLVQPLPDSEYNSDSLLEFLNNTENIEEYLNNLGKEDMPSLVNMLDKNENSNSLTSFSGCLKQIKCAKKKESKSNYEMEIDVLDSDFEIVKELLLKETTISKSKVNDKTNQCLACKNVFESADKLTQHYVYCDCARRYCTSCDILFDSKQKLISHKSLYHSSVPCNCNCGEYFNNKNKLLEHYKHCLADFGLVNGLEYRCKECGVTYTDRSQLYKHVKDHVLKSQMKMCFECGHNFVGETALATHKKNVHPIQEDVIFR